MKFEEFNSTVKSFFETNGVTWSDKKVNDILGKNYYEVYNNESKRMIQEKYSEEFEMFDYPIELT